MLLQKPQKQSKAKEHSDALSRRLALWQKGQISSLISEGRCIQARLPSSPSTKYEENLAKKFAKLMSMGKIREALRCIEDNTAGGVLAFDDIINLPNRDPMTVLARLKELHPPAQQAVPKALIHDHPEGSLPCTEALFDAIDAPTIKKIASRCKGSAGPSGLDAYVWKRMCTAFGHASNYLCHALAAVARKLCKQPVAPSGLSALVACRLIPLDKYPGIRPIGVGEVSRRIVAKAVMSVVKEDVTHAAGALQVCAGQEGGVEAAIHAMDELFHRDEVEAVLLADASNAFNSLNRNCALHNMQYICPPLSLVLRNTYQAPVRMFVPGGGEISSCEGTTQGDVCSGNHTTHR